MASAATGPTVTPVRIPPPRANSRTVSPRFRTPAEPRDTEDDTASGGEGKRIRLGCPD